MRQFLFCIPLILASLGAWADVAGVPVNYATPTGLIEVCVKLAPIPGGVFSKKEQKTEDDLCALNIYDPRTAVCPKLWSTSPGTILYSTEGTNLTQSQFEDTRCGVSNRGKNTKLAKFKNSMNADGTSATYAQSSMAYYELAHYFQTVVKVPVAVYRTLDLQVHLSRVTLRANPTSPMLAAGWAHELSAEEDPNSYSPKRDLFNADFSQIYGVLLDDGGPEEYGAEFNGVRSAWGDAQNRDFQETPGFLALRSEESFARAVSTAENARQSDKINAALGVLPLTPLQVGLWMRDLTEITLLDYILSQQDRVGNIDYDWYWVFVQDGVVKMAKETRPQYKDVSRRSMKAIAPPVDIAGFHPELVQRTAIDDNDAGTKVEYANFTKRTQMLEKIRHFDAGIYRRLLALNADLAAKGPLYRYLSTSLNLTTGEVGMIVQNTALATRILQTTCLNGQLHFDLDMNGIVTGRVQEVDADCR